MLNIKSYIQDLDLQDGQTMRKDCPLCRGINTFTASNLDGKVMWNCYKANCTLRGNTKVNIDVSRIRQRLNKSRLDIDNASDVFEIPEWIVPTRTNSINDFLIRWNIYDVEVLCDIKQERAVFPIRNTKTNTIVGATGRAMNPRSFPKWLKYGNCSVPYIPTIASESKSNVAVVVEDAISACVVSKHFGHRGVTGLALLGTSLGEEHVAEIIKYDKVIVALDPDALPKTLAIVKTIRSHMQNINALKLADDLKYANPQDMERLLDLLEHGEYVLWN